MEGETTFVGLVHVTKYDWFMFHIFLDFFKNKKIKTLKRLKGKFGIDYSWDFDPCVIMEGETAFVCLFLTWPINTRQFW